MKMNSENINTSKNIKLNMSRRIRRTPFTNKVEECGVSDFTVVNHMLLPKGFKNTVEEDYWHLREKFKSGMYLVKDKYKFQVLIQQNLYKK